MEVASVLVTGANKGIGLEFVKQLVNLPKPPRYVFATYRNKNTIQALEDIAKTSKQSKVVLIKMDVTSAEDIKAAGRVIEETVGDGGLTLLINNAGAARMSMFPNIDEEDLLFHFKTNTVAPVMIFQAALNMVMRMTASVVKEQGILVVNMCPGWVKTDINQRTGEMEAPESISSILNTLSRLDDTHHGTYIDRNGVTIPF